MEELKEMNTRMIVAAIAAMAMVACGEEDTACHAHKGRTARTDVMYSPGGCAYIYLCYGMHEMLNVVTGQEGRPEAVLIRGVEGFAVPRRPPKNDWITDTGKGVLADI